MSFAHLRPYALEMVWNNILMCVFTTNRLCSLDKCNVSYILNICYFMFQVEFIVQKCALFNALH